MKRLYSLLLAIPLLAGLPARGAYLEVDSPYRFDETIQRLKTVLPLHELQFVREQDIWDGLPDSPTARAKILFFCNFDLLNEAKAVEPSIGQAMPCRFTVLESEGKVKVLAVTPDEYMSQSARERLDGVCDTLQDRYTTALWEALQ
jgi:cytochrome c oxidase cbb3-type subunit 3